MASKPTDQRLPFLFEVWPTKVKPSSSFVLPVNPENLRKTQLPRTTVTQTVGGAWEDNFGLGLPKWTLQGTFGYLGTKPGGNAKTIKGVDAYGWQIFKEIEGAILGLYEMYGTYSNGGTTVSTSSRKPELRFYNFSDLDYWAVQVNRFEVSRSIQRRHLYTYTLDMTGLRQLDTASKITVVLDTYTPQTVSPGRTLDDSPSVRGGTATAGKTLPDSAPLAKEFAAWRSVLTGYQKALGVSGQAITQYDTVMANLNLLVASVGFFRQGISDAIRAPVEILDDSLTTVDNLLATIESVQTIPDEFIVAVRDVKRTLLAFNLHRNLFQDPTATLPSDLQAVSVEMMTASKIAMDNPETTLFGSTEGTEEGNTTEVTVLGSDTLETVAHRYMGDSGQWQRLALLNDLAYPYDLVAGQKILVPMTGAGALAILGQTTEEFYNKAFGSDEYLDKDGLHQASSTGGLSSLVGISNLEMQLSHLLNTSRGELTEIGHPDYGCLLPSLIGRAGIDLWFERAKVEARSALLSDPRIDRVSSLDILREGTMAILEADVFVVGQDTATNLSLVLQ